MLWAVLNFLLFVALLVHFLRAPIRDYFRTRGERLIEALAAGARARQKAEALRAAIARDLADLPALRERLPQRGNASTWWLAVGTRPSVSVPMLACSRSRSSSSLARRFETSSSRRPSGRRPPCSARP